MKSLCVIFFFGLLFLAEFEANRLTRARVPNNHARGPTTTNGEFLCFRDDENGFQICIQEGTAPQFREGEPGYGSQNYMGYFTLLSDPITHRGFVYGHSLTGRVNTYVWFQYEEIFYSYSFDYCPEIWKNPPTAYFSVYHALKGSLTSATFLDLISKNPFTQENANIGIPGGAQVACSTERFPVPISPVTPLPPTLPPQPPQPEPVEGKPPSNGHLKRSESLLVRGPSVSGEPEQGYCFIEDYHPEERWYFSGGVGSAVDPEGSAIHQFYRGQVKNINTGTISFAYGHSPRGSRNLIFSSNIPNRGLVTYHIMFDSNDYNHIEGGYVYVGSQENMEIKQVFQRAQFYQC